MFAGEDSQKQLLKIADAEICHEWNDLKKDRSIEAR